MSDYARPRWPAYVCTVLIAGVGHWYLGKWRRGIAWFSLYALALAFLSARTIRGAVEPGDPFVVTALQLGSVAYTDVAVPLAVLLVCLLDVYLIGVAEAAGSSEPMDENRSNR
ncbi:hypothetical protein HALLA_16510 [Halostagnicola larsenii XH-48]|uniref:TM2 domain-containing protein n=1 Tax=Halostagnicola larsenii XH-48 TaxID=797299 RepID=W0JNI3_9EURY|nr:hypothetical protein [Halostagnicola larsenii]AHG00164.1 hypothetical protein HALLA_16510 [Halostagnicola larsenii XH-48]